MNWSIISKFSKLKCETAMELLTAKRTDRRKFVSFTRNCWYIVPSVDAHHIPASGKVPRSGIKEHVLSQIGLSQSFSLPSFWLLIPFHAFAPIGHDCQLTHSLMILHDLSLVLPQQFRYPLPNEAMSFLRYQYYGSDFVDSVVFLEL